MDVEGENPTSPIEEGTTDLGSIPRIPRRESVARWILDVRGAGMR